MLCVNGQNFYPVDIEQAIRECHPAIRPAAIMATPVEIKDTEQLIIMVELNEAVNPNATSSSKSALGSNEIQLATKLFKKAQVSVG